MIFVTCPRLDESIGILRNAWETFFYKSKTFASLFFNHIFIKKKITHERGEIGLPLLMNCTLLQGFVKQHGQTARTRSICRSLFVAVLVGITVCVPVSRLYVHLLL